ncbi:MAG: hypothetical protein V4621_00090 [Pseudomonadota bacterium]
MTINRFVINYKNDGRGPQIGYALHTSHGQPTQLDIHVLDVANIHTPYIACVATVHQRMLDIKTRLGESPQNIKTLFRDYPSFWEEKDRASLRLSFNLNAENPLAGMTFKRDVFRPDRALKENDFNQSLVQSNNAAHVATYDIVCKLHSDPALTFRKPRLNGSKAWELHHMTQQVYAVCAAFTLQKRMCYALYAIPHDSLTCPIPTHLQPYGMVKSVWAYHAKKHNPLIHVENVYDGISRKKVPVVPSAQPLLGYGQFLNAVQLSCAVSGQVSLFNPTFIGLAAAAENDLCILSHNENFRKRAGLEIGRDVSGGASTVCRPSVS